MSAENDITGDSITTKPTSTAYRDGWERIFQHRKRAQAEIVEKRAAQIRRKAETIMPGISSTNDDPHHRDANAATESDAGAFEFEWREGGSE